jgi:predicted RecB family nuclease
MNGDLKMTKQNCKYCGAVLLDTEKGEELIYSCLICPECDKVTCFDPPPNISDIPGIGPKKEELLKKADIYTLKDLINCTKAKASEISGVGIASLIKWKKKARQLLNK